jgi:predicted transposase YdaD
MLLTEWNMEDAIAYNREEAWEEGRKESRVQIAQTALAKGLPMELIHEITGLDLDAIKDIQAGV